MWLNHVLHSFLSFSALITMPRAQVLLSIAVACECVLFLWSLVDPFSATVHHALARPGHKFRSVHVARLQVEADPTGGKLAATSGKLGGAPHKLTAEVQFHVGDTITALQRAVMQPGGQEVILYGTVMGAIGALYPFTSREVGRVNGWGQKQLVVTCRGCLVAFWCTPRQAKEQRHLCMCLPMLTVHAVHAR